MFYSIEQDLHRQRYTQPRHRNLSSQEYKAIKSLQHNPDIVIKPADKGSAIVILDRQYYISEGLRQLNDHNFYEQTNIDYTGEVINRVNLHVHNMLQRGQITERTCNYLTTNIDRTQQLYLLPKIHKDPLNPPGRPIVSGSGGPTERISQIVDHFIGNIVPLSQSYIRDSTHLINILTGISLQPGMLLCTLDITSLYTNIPHNEGIEAIKKMLAINRPPGSKPHNSYIIELLELVLTNNHFEFNGNYYHQLSGTAMGTKLVPSYANLFMATFEDKYVYTYPQKPTLWKRFIDDIFLIWPHGRESLLRFIEHLNRVHPTIKFTSDISDKEIAFLDLTIYISYPHIHTRIYTKSTDRHMYLDYSSEHPITLKNSVPYSQFLRLKRIHSEIHYLLEAEIHMYLYFRWRNYPHHIILDAWTKTNQLRRTQLLTKKPTEDQEIPLMFITTYNKTNPNLKEIISNHWSYLGRSSATRDLSKRDFMITYRKPPSLKDILVKAKLPQPRQKTNKECKRPKSCKYCTKMFQSGKIKNSYNNKTYNTTTKGTCQSNNLIYCIECNWCHIKYVGQTKNRIIDRFQGHLFDIKNNLNTTVARHFGSHNDKIDPNMTIHISSLRDNRELVLIHRLNTLIPNGLNILD